MLRSIGGVSFDSHTAGLFRAFRVINIYNLYNYRLSNMFKTENNRNTHFLKNLANLYLKEPVYPTRHAHLWEMVARRTNYGSQMVRYTLPKLLNQLEESELELNRISPKQLREYFISLDR